MSPTPVRVRIAVDFSDAIHPSRTWILGITEDGGRVEVLTFDQPPSPPAVPSICECPRPNTCEHGHTNE